MPSIASSTILIIGGTSGIGYAVADKCLSEGAVIHISSSDRSKLKETVYSLKEKHPSGEITVHVCDLFTQDVEQNLEKLFKEIGDLDHIVNTTGVLAVKPLKEIDSEFITKAGEINIIIPLLIAKLALPYLRPSHNSSLILTTGVISQKPVPDWPVAVTYAAGIHGMVRSLALEMLPRRVNVVSAGPVRIPLLREVTYARGETTALGKIGEPEEVAEAYLYLMKDTNATGSCVNSDGGYLLV